jgi:hypothetical protein
MLGLEFAVYFSSVMHDACPEGVTLVVEGFVA